MKFYALQSPRGFSNEVNAHSFPSKKERDNWVKEHEHDGDVNSAALGAYSVSAKKAKQILSQKDDDLTKYYNQEINHGGA